MNSDKAFELAGVVPWGRTAGEYQAFFNLDELAPETRILDCGGGPSSFTAECAGHGRPVVAADPVYALTAEELEAAFNAAVAPMRRGMELARDRFIWDYYGSPGQVLALRRTAFHRFARDRAAAPPDRYVNAALPDLPFDDDAFDLVTCSHLLFLYSEQLDLAFHIAALREMLRVAPEARVFPLLDMDGRPSAHLDAAMDALSMTADVARVPVAFEFQRGACEMLRLRRRQA